MTRNGKDFGEKGVITLNILPARKKNYATFLVYVMEHFAKKGFPFDYLSPVNEPQWDWGGNSQEGTPATNEEIYILDKYLSNEFSKRGLPTQIVIGEAGTIGHASINMELMGKKASNKHIFITMFI